MTTPSSNFPELLSALADGELSADHDAGLQEVFESSSLHADWNSYQVIGQVLRGGVAGLGEIEVRVV